jgi:hypothetical protein
MASDLEWKSYSYQSSQKGHTLLHGIVSSCDKHVIIRHVEKNVAPLLHETKVDSHIPSPWNTSGSSDWA